jgi:phosphopantothenoylcysteine decarboxylase/phosphopantothenate--cysteine ligase
MPNVALGVTGCIAAYKACEVVRELQRHDVDVRVVMTANATRFVSAMTFEALSRHPVFVDQFALGSEAEIQHVALAASADLLLVAPATANILGKLAHGIADDALSTLYLATAAPTVVAPAMNVEMLRHPAVAANLDLLRGRGVGIVEPGSGYLACGWLGRGRLAEVGEIVDAALGALVKAKDLAGETVLVTAGPTVEDIDPVRFISNRSSGRMGFAVAEAARDRGAPVVLVSGPTSLADPRGVEVIRVRSAEQMAAAVERNLARATVIVMAAAVSDFRPAFIAGQKVKKDVAAPSLDLVRTPDILRGLRREGGDRILVGFAAETESLLQNARRKRAEKGADLMVANDVSLSGSGFGGETNSAILIDDDGEVATGLLTKRELAERLLDRVVVIRGRRVRAS